MLEGFGGQESGEDLIDVSKDLLSHLPPRLLWVDLQISQHPLHKVGNLETFSFSLSLFVSSALLLALSFSGLGNGKRRLGDVERGRGRRRNGDDEGGKEEKVVGFDLTADELEVVVVLERHTLVEGLEGEKSVLVESKGVDDVGLQGRDGGRIVDEEGARVVVAVEEDDGGCFHVAGGAGEVGE